MWFGKNTVSLVAMVVLVVDGGVALTYAVNGYSAHPHAAGNGGDHKGDHLGTDDIFFLDGLDGLLGDDEDHEEPD